MSKNQHTTSFEQQRRLFKAYDIRGDCTLFNDTFINALSHTFAQNLLSTVSTDANTDDGSAINVDRTIRIVIGYDMRHGSLKIAKQFAATFCHYNIKVYWLGMITTPIMAFWSSQFDGHGLIATASHSNKNTIGLKWLVNNQSPTSLDIQQLYHRLCSSPLKTDYTSSANSYDSNSAPITDLSFNKVVHQYIEFAHQCIDKLEPMYNEICSNKPDKDKPKHDKYKHDKYKLDKSETPHCLASEFTVVIDCLNGTTGLLAAQFFKYNPLLCTNVITLNDKPDGNFPKGNPDPVEQYRLEELSNAVIKHNADIGLGFDGDGDRLMVVANDGRVAAADHLLFLLAQLAVQQYQHLHMNTNNFKNPSVIFDVKCSHHLPNLIKKINAVPIMHKTGSSYLRHSIKNQTENASTKIIFAGELSGHFIFGDGLFIIHDDAMYAALRLIHWLKYQTQSLASILDALPAIISTPDVYLPLESHTHQTKNPINPIAINGKSHTLFTNHPVIKSLNQLCSDLSFKSKHDKSKLSVNITSSIETTIDNAQIDKAQISIDSNNPVSSQVMTAKKSSPNTSISDDDLQVKSLKTQGYELPNNTVLTCIDGLRLDFDHGFGIIRPSNTSNCLTVRFAGDTYHDLKTIHTYFVNLCQTVDPDLAKRIASIAI